MGFYDSPTSDAPTTPASGGFFDTPPSVSVTPAGTQVGGSFYANQGNSDSAFPSARPTGPSPAVHQAVSMLPPALSKGQVDLKNAGDFISNLFGKPQISKALSMLPAPKSKGASSMMFPITDFPDAKSITKQGKNLETIKNNLDPTNKEAIDSYNTQVKSFNENLTKYQTQYSQAQGARKVLSKDYIPTPYDTPMKIISHDLSNIYNKPIEIAGDVLGSTKVFQNLAKNSDEGKGVPSFIESLAQHLQMAQGAVSGFTGGIVQPNYTGDPNDFASKLVSTLSQGVGMAASLGLGESALSGVSAPKMLLQNFQDYPKVQQLFNSLAKSIPAFAAYGQLNPSLNGVGDRLKTLGTDILTAVPYTALGLFSNKAITIPASAALGFGMAKLSGASNQDAATSAVALGLLSLFGESPKSTGKEVITQAQAKGRLYDEAIDTINKYSETKITKDSSASDIKKAFREAALKTHPDTGGTNTDFSSVNYARDVLLGENKTSEAKATETKTSEEKMSDIVNEVKQRPKPTVEKPTGDIIVGRHGDIDKVDDGIAHGQTNDPLNDTGVEDAQKLGQEWQGKGITTVISSDLPRGSQTAGIAAKAIGATVKTDPLLRTWNIGEFNGKPKTEVDPKLEYYRAHPTEKIPGGESFQDFQNRINKGIAANKGPNTAFVMHNEALKALGETKMETGDTKTITLGKEEPKFNIKESKKTSIKEKTGRKTLPERPVEPQRVTEYKQRLKLKGADPVLVDAIITPSGNRAYGVSHGGTLTFEKTVEHLTEDHEVFHQVFQNMEKMKLFKKFDKTALLDEAKDLYGDIPPEKLEEEMAKDFQQYVNERENNKPSSFFGKVKDFFDRLFASLKRIFKTETDIKEFYRTMSEGKAKEETVIKDTTPKSFNEQRKEGVVDFRARGEAIKNFNEEVPTKDTFSDSGDLTLKTITKLEGRTTVSKQYIEDLTNSGDIKQVEREIIRQVLAGYPDGAKIPVKQFVQDVKIELLPLSVHKISGLSNTKYEDITLPESIRGDIVDYKENIYSSPIKTSAGDVHFFGETSSYFGHTRIEDMGTGDPSDDLISVMTGGKEGDTKLRRVIEVQSDLYQKGRLEGENMLWTDLKKGESHFKLKQKLGEKEYERRKAQRKQEISKLEQYNDPTAHFRMVREEVRQAAKDGKTELQFPTGETAMKIEGLGETASWNYTDPKLGEQSLTTDDLKIGKTIFGENGGTWIIVDVLGEGKFIAVPKNRVATAPDKLPYATPAFDAEGLPTINGLKYDNLYTETFDISNKIDTNNPIYRFYEKDLGRYLKNNYGAQLITDDKGVTWYEVPITKGMAKLPVPAFNIKPEKDVADLRNQLEKAQGYLDMAVSNKEVFGDKIPELQTKVDDLRKQIADIKNPPVSNAKEALVQAEKRVGVKPVDIPKLQNQLQREYTSLAAAKEMPEAHQKAYGEDRVPKYEAKIKELEEKIQSATPQIEAPKIRVSGKDIEIPGDLQERAIELEIRKEAIEQNPLKGLLKYVQKTGDDAGHLPEVGRVNNKKVSSKFRMSGDGLIQEAMNTFTHYKDAPSEAEVREAMDKYIIDRNKLKSDTQQLKTEIKTFIKEEKDKLATEKFSQGQQKITDKEDIKQARTKESESLKEWQNFVATYAHEQSLPKSLEEVEPPKKKGNIQSPKLDIKSWKDIHSLGSSLPYVPDVGVSSANRDPFVRNIEKVATREDAKTIKKFIVDTINEAGTNMARETTKDLKELREKIVTDLGIRLRSKDDYLMTAYSQGYISENDFIKNTDRPEVLRKAIKIAQDYYSDKIRNQWNPTLEEYGYDPIPIRDNYLPHMKSINFWTENFGFLQNNNELPTEIVGKTEFFKPGRIFSARQLKRLGNESSIGLIDGLTQYAKSVNTQIYSIKPIQHARALDEYVRLYIENAKRLGTPISLVNFMTNFNEYIEANLAGKTAAFDRGIIKTTGRPIVNTLNGIGNIIGTAIIGYNPSVALSHLVSIPLNAATVGKVPMAKGIYDVLTSPFAKDFSMIDGQQSNLIARRYPTEHIDTIWYQSPKRFASWLVQRGDEFKVRLSVASKYYELKDAGMDPQEAMRQADLYGARIAGDQTYGNAPNLFKNKSLSTFTKFQLGMNDAISVWLHDIPYESKSFKEDEQGNIKENTDYKKLFSKLAQAALYSWLLNQMYKKVRGSGKGVDPIDWMLTLLGVNEEGRDKAIFDRLKLVGSDIAADLPFINFFTGNFIIPNAVNSIISAPGWISKLESVGAVTIPGGTQIKKTIEGGLAYKQGFKTSKSGIPQFGVDKSGWRLLQALVFGPSSGAAAQAYYNSIGSTSPGKKTFDEIQQLKADGKIDEANAITQAMTSKEYGTYKAQLTKLEETKFIPQAQKILDLLKSGKNTEANQLTSAMTPGEYKIYKGAKAMILKAQSVNSTNNNNGLATFEGHSTYYGGSTGPDASKILGGNPDDGNISGYNPKGEPIYERDKALEASRRKELIKQDPYWNVTASQYDHIIPLEAGGTNTANNVMLISKYADEGNQAFEDYLGGLYKTGAISRADAAKASIDYKIKKTVSLNDIINGKY